MKKANITEKTFSFFASLTTRHTTNRIVLHHTGGADIDAYAEQIHQWHLEKDYAGIGYHFVIRKSGEIERGRPVWAIGAHAYGANNDSIGIHISGEFTYNAPTDAQIESAALLIANLCEDYNIPLDREHVIGHREVTPTDCPGNVLFNLLDVIIGKARWYKYEDADIIDAPAEPPKIIFKPRAGMLSEHFSENEFKCQHCGKVEVDARLIELLENLRWNIGGYPILIERGFDCTVAKRMLETECNAYHDKGKAVDVAFPRQLSRGQFKWYIEQLPFDAIGYYPEHVHLDVRHGGKGDPFIWEV